MKPKIFDITPKISPRLAVFPGDQPFERAVALSFAQGHHLELSAIKTTLHLGAHADAPSHYGVDGVGIDQRDPLRYIGRAQVIHIKGLQPKARIRREDVSVKIQAPRVLFATSSFPDPERWAPDFNSLSPDLLHHLAEQGVVTVGIDTPSVDPEDSKALEAHQVLRARDLAVLEGLVLTGVPEGLYILLAQPLPIEAGDASPVRALLLPPDHSFE
jgi:arylformamidase